MYLTVKFHFKFFKSLFLFVLNQAFYAVMNMTDDELRTSYMMKSPEEYKRQLEEDVAVEKYWLQRLVLLEKD